jgi:hypothetical protein
MNWKGCGTKLSAVVASFETVREILQQQLSKTTTRLSNEGVCRFKKDISGICHKNYRLSLLVCVSYS